MSGSLQGRIVTDVSRLAELAPDWQRLCALHPRPQTFYDWPFHRAVWDAYGHDRRLCTAVVCDDATVVGILPLASAAGGTRFLATPHADYHDLLCEPDRAGPVLLAALTALHAHGERRILFQHLPPDALLLRAQGGLPAAWRKRLRSLPGDHCPTLLIRSPDDYQQVLGKQSLRRHAKGLGKLGALSFERLTDREAVRARLPEFFAQHEARRACAGDRSLFVHGQGRAFYHALLEHLDPGGDLHFAELRCGDVTVAFHLGFVRDRRFTWYKPTIHVDYWDAGPGEVLLKALLEDARDRQLVEFDFTRGDEAFKQRFANHDRPNTHLLLLAPGVRGAVERTTLTLGAAVRHRSRLHAAAKRCRQVLADLAAARRRHGVSGVLTRVARRLLRGIHARDEVLVFHRQARSEPAALAQRGLALRQGRLSELAACAARHGEFFDRRRMQQARQRLKDGDQLWLAVRGDRVVHVAWLGERPEIVAASEVGREITLPLASPATVVYDCWTPEDCRGQGIYAAVLSNLQPLVAGQELWIYCHRRNEGSVRGIRRAGFEPGGRLGRRVWFGRFRSWWR